MPAVMDPRDIVFARLGLLAAYYVGAHIRALKMTLRRPPTPYRAFLARVAGEVGEVVKRLEAQREAIIRETLARLEERYPWLALLAGGPYPALVRLAIASLPPQVTIPRLYGSYAIHPGTYISIGFLPVRLRDGRVHNPRVARIAFSAFKAAYWMRRRQLLQKYPALARVYERSLKRYEPERGRAHAERLAFRDAYRVLIGCAWLLWVCSAVEEGAIAWDDVPLPYALARDPSLHQDMVNPADIVPGAPAGCTWARLVREKSAAQTQPRTQH